MMRLNLEYHEKMTVPQNWTQEELATISRLVEQMVELGQEELAANTLQTLVAQELPVLGILGNTVRDLYKAKQIADSTSLYEGLKKIGKFSDDFLSLLAERLEIVPLSEAI